MTFDRRLATALLAAAGVLMVHEVAYGLYAIGQASLASSVRHGYLDLLWTFVGPLAGFAAVRLGVHRVRALGPVALGTPTLALNIVAGFLGLEFGERVLAGVTVQEAVASPVIWIGVALVLPLAMMLQRAIAVTVDVLDHVLGHVFGPGSRMRTFVGAPQQLLVVASLTPAMLDLLGYSLHRRGPPIRS